VLYIVNETKIGAKNDELVKHFKVDEDLDNKQLGLVVVIYNTRLKVII
jgi:hypothetical protein